MTSSGRKTGAIAVVAAFAAGAALFISRSPSDERQSRPEVASAPARVLTSVGRVERDLNRRFSRTVDGVRFSYTLSSWSRGGDDWSGLPIVHTNKGFRVGRLGISKSIVGPQGAEAIIFWTSFPDGYRAKPCPNLLGRRIGRSADDLAAAVAAAPGTRLIAGPSDVTVGGLPAKHVVLSVRKDLGCDPGLFYSWQSECWGPCWVQTNPGDRIRVWIVRVKGTRLFFEAETTKEADLALEQEISQIVESIRFR